MDILKCVQMVFSFNEIKGIQKELWISDAIRILAKISNPESKNWDYFTMERLSRYSA
jgi:hypothetical protein